MSDQLDTLLDEAEDRLTTLESSLADEEAMRLDDLGEDTYEDAIDTVDVLTRLADETEDLLEEIDLTELPELIDGSDVREAIDSGEIPEAVSDEEDGDVVRFRQLVRAINLSELWDSANVRGLLDEADDLGDTVDNLTDEDDDAGFVGDAASEMADDDLLDGDDPSDLGGEQSQMYQTMIQQQALDGLEEFREALLLTHEKFQKLYETNREKMGRQDTSSNSRNPTAVSTLTTSRRDLGSTERHSTVPTRVKHSTAPGHTRIYGRRFERELEKRRGEDE